MPPSDSGDRNGEISSLGSQWSGCLDDIFPETARPIVLSQDYGPHITSRDRTRDSSPTKKIPRPPNSYMIFLSDLRDSNASSKITTSLAGELWRKLSREDKQHYQRRSEHARRQHALQYPAYTLQPKKGSDRRPYGSRKTPAQRASKLINTTTASSRTEGPFDVAAPKCPSRPGCHQPQPDPTHIHTFGMSSLPSSPQAIDAVLGLYHVPGPTLQPPFPSPPTPVGLPLVPIEISGIDSPPTDSQYSPLTYFPIQTPPTVYNTPLMSYTSSYHTTQPFMDSQSQYSSSLLYFEQLSLDDQVHSHTFTSRSDFSINITS